MRLFYMNHSLDTLTDLEEGIGRTKVAKPTMVTIFSILLPRDAIRAHPFVCL